VSGCGGTNAIISKGDQIVFHQYVTVQVSVADGVKNDYSSGAIPLFDGMLKAKLVSMGFKVVDSNPDLKIDLTVVRADPGNKALRMIVGMGTGQVRLGHRTLFTDKQGIVVAEFSGWEGQFMKEQIQWDSDRLRLELVRVCVDKIGKFIKMGKIEERQ
jgi:hypothetical protein